MAHHLTLKTESKKALKRPHLSQLNFCINSFSGPWARSNRWNRNWSTVLSMWFWKHSPDCTASNLFLEERNNEFRSCSEKLSIGLKMNFTNPAKGFHLLPFIHWFVPFNLLSQLTNPNRKLIWRRSQDIPRFQSSAAAQSPAWFITQPIWMGSINELE